MSEPRRAARFWFGWWLACFALWLLLTSTVSPNEVLTGVAAAAVAATAAALTRADRPADRLPGRELLRFLAALPVRIGADTVLLVRVLLRPADHAGHFTEVPAAGRGPTFETEAAILVSAAPNHYLVDFGDDGTATLHGLVRRDHRTLEEVMLRP